MVNSVCGVWQVEEYAQAFMERANKLIEVSGSTQYVGVCVVWQVEEYAQALMECANKLIEVSGSTQYVGYGRWRSMRRPSWSAPSSLRSVGELCVYVRYGRWRSMSKSSRSKLMCLLN